MKKIFTEKRKMDRIQKATNNNTVTIRDYYNIKSSNPFASTVICSNPKTVVIFNY